MRSTYSLIMALVIAQQLWAEILRVPTDYATPAAALSAASTGDTILLEPGTHFGHLLLNFPITLASEFILSGDTADIWATILRPPTNTSTQVLSINALDSTSEIVGLMITGGRDYSGGGIGVHNSSIVIRDNIIENNMADAGAGIYCSNSSPKILRNTISGGQMYSPISNPGGGICMDNGSTGEIAYNIITDNVNQDGGGIACRNSSPHIHHNVISGNTALDIGGGMRMDNSDPLLENNVIYGNHASHGGGLNHLEGSSPTIRNCIFWGNDASGQDNQIEVQSGSPTLSYCTIQDGWSGEEILEDDPLFRNAENGDFHLQSIACGDEQDSPCIDAGDPLLADLNLNCESGLGEERSDIGAFGGNIEAEPNETAQRPLPSNFMVADAYPNPFNGNVSLRYSLAAGSRVGISVYNSTGQMTEQFELGWMQAGRHESELNFERFATGNYFVRIQAGASAQIVKLQFVK